jgi:hypothetical protein
MPYIVLAAEIATLAVMVLYSAVLFSMHREAGYQSERPRPDPVGRALANAARFAFYTGTGAVIVLSLYGGLQLWPMK